jgi:hypothetical protein
MKGLLPGRWRSWRSAVLHLPRRRRSRRSTILFPRRRGSWRSAVQFPRRRWRRCSTIRHQNRTAILRRNGRFQTHRADENHHRRGDNRELLGHCASEVHCNRGGTVAETTPIVKQPAIAGSNFPLSGTSSLAPRGGTSPERSAATAKRYESRFENRCGQQYESTMTDRTVVSFCDRTRRPDHGLGKSLTDLDGYS